MNNEQIQPISDAPHQDAGYAGPVQMPSTGQPVPPASQPYGAPSLQSQQHPQPSFSQSAPPVQNIYITQQVQQAPTPVIVAAAPKSVVAALVLTFFFGPLGMFYSTVPGALIMLVVSIIAIPLTLGGAALITWPICMVWAAIAASNANTRATSVVMTQNAPR